MGFKNPKNDSLEMILTEHGRKLLSQGRLNVKYYTFGDDEVDYSGTMELEINVSEIPASAILDMSGDPILDESGDYIIEG